MTLLSSLLPGIRDFRAPFTVGLLWLTALVLAVNPHRKKLSELTGLGDSLNLALSLPQPYVAAGLAFVAYVLGLAAVQAARLAGKAVVNVWGFRWIGERLDDWNYQTMSLANEVVALTLKEGTAKDLDQLVPPSLLMMDTTQAALQLSESHPEQFQQYDRTRAEAEFRTTAALPLFAVGASLALLSESWYVSSAIVLVFLAVSISLLVQGARQSSEAMQTILVAVVLGWTTLPGLKMLQDGLHAAKADALKEWQDLGEPESLSPEPDDATQYAVVLNGVLGALSLAATYVYFGRIRELTRTIGLTNSIVLTPSNARRLRAFGLGEYVDPEISVFIPPEPDGGEGGE